MYKKGNSSMIHASMRRISAITFLSLLFLWTYEGFVRAADEAICGDAVKAVTEQCDDGNLLPADGCSIQCTIEVCGNGITDVREQCDDGNTRSQDGCSSLCFIEFCGDGILQGDRGEQCDDGNGIDGDDCSAVCIYTGKISSSSSTSSQSSESSSSSTSSITSSSSAAAAIPWNIPSDIASPSVIQTTLSEVRELLSSGGGGTVTNTAPVYMQNLPREEKLKLEIILKKLGQGKRLNASERIWAKDLAVKLDDDRKKSNAEYDKVLTSFLGSTIAQEAVKSFDKELLQKDPEQALEVFTATVKTIDRKTLTAQTTRLVESVEQYGIYLAPELREKLDPLRLKNASALEVFSLMTDIKHSIERFAATDIAVSLDALREQIVTLRQATTLFVRGYGVDPKEFSFALDDIETALAAKRVDTQEVVARIEELLKILQSSKVFDPKTLSMVDVKNSELLERLAAVTSDSNMPQVTLDEAEVEQIVIEASKNVSADQYARFSSGSLLDHRRGLLLFLDTDPKIQYLREELTSRGVQTMEQKFWQLHHAIEVIGEPNAVDPCSASIDAGMQCIKKFLPELQEAVREASIVLRVVGFFQDLFHIQ